MKRPFAAALLCFLIIGISFAGAGDGGWLGKVPQSDRARINPLAKDAEAPLAGAKLYAENCASCHGKNAEGKMQGRRYRPNLHSNRIKQATGGELFWILTKGSLRNGMPSWSRFPELERWQLVSYLKSLP
ncbi:MAG TPA: c-type cytochrome [Candidatus Sulfotelmatobacter sp.]|nr:c-type cytochrome [Candidatus Sulfotelmatobacter sp.]